MEFKRYSFKELLENIVDNRGKTCPVEEQGIPLIATNCIKDNSLYAEYERVRYVSDATYKTWFRSHPEPEDIIFVCKGSPGRVAWVQNPVPYCIAQDMVAIRANKNIIDSKFLFALLRNPQTQKSILNMHVGTMIPHFKKGDFANLYFDIPQDLTYQKWAGELYFSFCDKIELNRQTNQTLEQMAQALFKSWFVDFDPVFDNALASGMVVNDFPEALQKKAAQRLQVQQQMANGEPSAHKKPSADKKTEAKPLPEAASASEYLRQLFPSEFEQSDNPSIGINGWIPKGWKPSSFESLIKLIGGGTPKTTVEEYWNGDIPWFSVVDAPNDSDVFVLDTEKHVTQQGVDKSSTKILRSGTTIISARGTVGKCALVAEPMAMNQSCYGINGIDGVSDEFIYFMTRHQVSDLQKRGHGSVFNTITRETFKSILLPFSGGEVTQKFSEVVSPFLNKILLNNKQNAELIKTRDILLPKLISDEITINKEVA